MTRQVLESLESRRLLSVSLAESEANDSHESADPIPRVLDEGVEVSGSVDSPGDRDWFKIDLQPGDVFGAAVDDRSKLDTTLRMVNSDGVLMIANDDSAVGRANLPAASPLPANASSITGAEIYYVVAKAGTYYVEVGASGDASTGRYGMSLLVTRPGMERQAAGARQVLFLDFDGANVNFSKYGPGAPSGVSKFSPMATSLPAMGLTASDEDAVIDAILARVTDKLATYVQANGLNPTSAIEIRNSRDHADTYGVDPLVARIVVGRMSDSEFAKVDFGGIAQHIDVGNFVAGDEAIGTTNWIEGAQNGIPTEPPLTAVDFFAHPMSLLIAHEMGHLLGAVHTDYPGDFQGVPTLMEDFTQTLGPDMVFGSDDDVDLQFVADAYAADEVYEGLNDTLNTVAFGLSTGTGAVAATAAPTGPAFSSTRIAAARRPSTWSLLDAPDSEDHLPALA